MMRINHLCSFYEKRKNGRIIQMAMNNVWRETGHSLIYTPDSPPRLFTSSRPNKIVTYILRFKFFQKNRLEIAVSSCLRRSIQEKNEHLMPSIDHLYRKISDINFSTACCRRRYNVENSHKLTLVKNVAEAIYVILIKDLYQFNHIIIDIFATIVRIIRRCIFPTNVDLFIEP